jgi:ribonuclease E
MLINATDSEEIRVAILKDGVLSDFDVEYLHNEKIKGNIYKAKVTRVDTSLQAAFVHYGGQKNGFLPIAELPRKMTGQGGRRARIQDLLQKDQEIMVQVIREELGTKGAMVTAQVSLPGRYLVLTPHNAINGISRKIESQEEREHFKDLVDQLNVPKGMGVIVRTASLGVTKEDFERDLDNLADTYKEIQDLYKKRVGAGLVWQEDDVVTRTLRDAWTVEIGEVHIDDLETFQAAQGFFRRTMPQHLGAIRHYTGKKPIFSKFQTEEQIEKIYSRRVPLPSGGAIVLDQTEALVAIDVNSGKTVGDNQEDTALRTNLEAAEEIAAQLRLRDLAGLIAIDFIDLRRDTNNKAVMDRLVECLRMDKARMEVGKINRFGVLVMTRQRIRPSIQHVTHETCPVCQGTGQVKNSEVFALSVLRRIKAALSRNDLSQIKVRLAPAIAMNLLNKRRHELAELEAAYESAIVVAPDHDVTYGEISIEILRKEEDQDRHRHNEAPERKRDAEDETVVLDGEAPISFHRALPHANGNAAGAGGRREIQRAALDERERLRSLFEASGPKNKIEHKKQGGHEEKPKAPKKEAPEPPKKQEGAASKPRPQKKEIPGPPKLTAEVIASLAVPTSQTRKLLMPSPGEPSGTGQGQPPSRKTRAKAAAKAKMPEPNKAASEKTVKPPPARSAAKQKAPQKPSPAKAVAANVKPNAAKPNAVKPKKADAKPKPAPRVKEAKAKAPAKTAAPGSAPKSRAKK